MAIAERVEQKRTFDQSKKFDIEAEISRANGKFRISDLSRRLSSRPLDQSEKPDIEDQILDANKRLRRLDHSARLSRGVALEREIVGIPFAAFALAEISSYVFPPDNRALEIAALFAIVPAAYGIVGAVDKFRKVKKLKQKKQDCQQEIVSLRQARNSRNVKDIFVAPPPAK